MTADLMVEYAQLLKKHFKSAKLVDYFLVIPQSDSEIEKLMEFIKNHPDATATDLDEYLIYMRRGTEHNGRFKQND